jgi:regulator of protease activity HflC (stomatin/prohibitin superfamily)
MYAKKTTTTSTNKSPDTGLHMNGVGWTLFTVITILGILAAVILDSLGLGDGWIALTILLFSLVAFYMLLALQIARQWEKAVVLRLGKFHALRGPGLFWVIPIVDSVTTWIDHRVMVTPFNAERTLTKDTVPVDVDAVLFWMVWDAEKAALEVANYISAIAWAAQTALREIIGQMTLADILVGRAKMDEELQKIIDGVSPDPRA